MNPKNPMLAAALSLIVPGSGAFYVGTIFQGAMTLGVYAIAWVWLVSSGWSTAPLLAVVVVAVVAGVMSYRNAVALNATLMVAGSVNGPLTPIPVERFVRELEELAAMKGNASLSDQAFDQRLARIIAELRSRKISGDRRAITQALDGLRERRVLSEEDIAHVTTRLGLGD